MTDDVVQQLIEAAKPPVDPDSSNMLELMQAELDINHPAHYGADSPYECIKVIEAWNLDFNLGTLLRYICRAGRKPDNPLLKDLKKGRWYLDREIANVEKALKK